MRNTRFIFIEGIMGSGKSTTAWFLTERLQGKGIDARFLAEGPTIDEPEHLLRVATTLPHPHAVWLDITIEEYISLSLQKWCDFMREAQQLSMVTVCDGLLFHGNMTDLLLMNADEALLRRYISQVLECLRPLDPTLIYLYQPDVAHALHTICETRGSWWQDYQVDWKVGSPYGKRHSLQGFDGLVQLYQTYSVLCDDIFAQLAIPKLGICNEGDWETYYHDILSFLDLDIEQKREVRKE